MPASGTTRIGFAPHEPEEPLGIFAVDGGKHLKEFVDSETVVEVVEQALRRHASGTEDEGATHHARVGSYRAATPTDHNLK